MPQSYRTLFCHQGICLPQTFKVIKAPILCWSSWILLYVAFAHPFNQRNVRVSISSSVPTGARMSPEPGPGCESPTDGQLHRPWIVRWVGSEGHCGSQGHQGHGQALGGSFKWDEGFWWVLIGCWHTSVADVAVRVVRQLNMAKDNHGTACSLNGKVVTFNSRVLEDGREKLNPRKISCQHILKSQMCQS